MKLKDVMTKKVQVIHPLSMIREAAQLMKIEEIGPLPVCDGDRLVGMLTDRDITIGAVAAGKDPSSTPVRDIMNRDVIYAFEDQAVEDAVRVMEKNEIKRLIVLNRSKRLVGIVSLGDLARRASNATLTNDVIAAASRRSRPRHLPKE